MYDYIEVTGDSLVCRTYGVDVINLAKETDESKVRDYERYLDGFILTK